MKSKISNYIFFVVFILISLLLVIFPGLDKRFSIKVLVLIGISFLPWFLKYIKSLEINGVLNIEFFPKEKIKEIEDKSFEIKMEIEDENITEIPININEVTIDTTSDFLFKYIGVEKKLRNIADNNQIKSAKSIKQLSKELVDAGIINKNIYSLICDISPLRNEIVHNGIDRITPRDLEISLNVINMINNYFENK